MIITLGNLKEALNPRLIELMKQYDDGSRPLNLELPDSNDEKKSYVYVWFTKDNHYIFYIGKGKKSRYKHILKEIDDFEKDHRKCKGAWYKEIRDLHGIDYEIIIDGLSDYEASLYEYFMMRKCIAEGEILLNSADMPISPEMENFWYDIQKPGYKAIINKHGYYKRYLNDNTLPTFSSFSNEDLLKVMFYSNSAAKKTYERIINEQTIISDWVQKNGGKIYKTVAKGCSIIVHSEIYYSTYKVLIESNHKVLRSSDVIDYISKC